MRTAVLLLIIVSQPAALRPQSTERSLCVAPVAPEPSSTSSGGLEFCHSGDFRLKIDGRAAFAWPRSKSLRLDHFDGSKIHRVVVLCGSKPQQAFKFRFIEYKTRELCLFLNDLYQTVQLWEPRQSPWCKCK
jgi:hypothetical protein